MERVSVRTSCECRGETIDHVGVGGEQVRFESREPVLFQRGQRLGRSTRAGMMLRRGIGSEHEGGVQYHDDGANASLASPRETVDVVKLRRNVKYSSWQHFVRPHAEPARSGAKGMR